MFSENIGSRLLISQIDEIAQEQPTRIWGAVPIDDGNLSKGFRNITFHDFANAINTAALWLENNLPPAASKFETIAYAGPKDVRYPILAVAAAKIGRKLLLPSAFLSSTGEAHILEESSCRAYLCGSELKERVSEVLGLVKASNVLELKVPELSELFINKVAPSFPFTKTWDEAADNPWLIFHTSGTTGFPKLITYTHRMMCSIDIAKLMPDHRKPRFSQSMAVKRWYTPLPNVQSVGMTLALQFPVFVDATVIFGPSSTIPATPKTVQDVIRYGQPHSAILTPNIIDALAEDPSGLGILKTLEILFFAGAPMSPATANKINDHVILKPSLGSTEAGAYFTGFNDKEDWEYHSFRPAVGLNFREYSDGLYEAVFIRKIELERWQQIFQVHPDLHEFRTGDLFKPHPSKEGRWKYVGRTDDMLVFSNGHNLHASNIESRIAAAHLDITAVLVGGNGRPKPFVLVEWDRGCELDDATKLGNLRLILEEVNQSIPKYLALTPELMLFATGDKRLVRTQKDSVARRSNLELWEKEIEGLYR